MQEIKSKLSEAIIIAIAPMTGYAIAFSYESGVAKTFGIPLSLISISFLQVIVALVALLSSFVVISLFFNLFYMVLASLNLHTEINNSLARVTPSFIMLIALMYIYESNWKEWIALLVVFFLLTFFEFIFPLITQRKSKGYTAKLEAQSKIEAQIPDVYSKLSALVGSSYFNLIFILAVLCFLSFSLGRSSALQQKEFLIYKKDPSRVVLRIYNDLIISGKYELATNKLSEELTLQKLSETETNLINKTIGAIR